MIAIEFPKALRTNILVGREEQKKLIRQVIRAQKSAFICFIGEGGLGKTRLLEQVPDLVHECAPLCRCSNIMDFYHAEFHLGSGIERAILHSLDPDKRCFSNYRQERKHYEKLRDSGADPQRLLALRQNLRDLFVKDFNACAQDTHPILLFDTIELIQYEGDYTQQQYPDIFDAEKAFWGETGNWLLQVLPRLENTVVVLAGRPGAAAFEKELNKALSGRDFYSRELGPFTAEETLAYLDALAETLHAGGDGAGSQTVREIRSYVGDKLYTLTHGEPLPLSMIVDMLYKGTIHPSDLDHLTFEQIPAQSARWMREFERDIMFALSYINLLRKGVNAKRLAMVTGWDETRCRNMLEAMQPFVFVKQRPDTDLLFLHDKMYEWNDQNAELAGFVDLEDVCSKIIDHYEQLIKEREETSVQVDALRAEQLYYHLLRNPEDGLSIYQEWADEALSGGRIEYEMSLRNEMLRFFKPDPRGKARHLTVHLEQRIARDSATRWVLRFLRHSDHECAKQIADRVWNNSEEPFDRGKHPLFEAVLLVYRGEALAYLGKLDDSIDDLSKAIDKLKNLQIDSQVVRGYLGGLAHKNLGYVYVRQRKYEQAINEYKMAIDILTSLAQDKVRRAQLELAHTQRNLAYVYGECGEKTDAEYYCEQALNSFKRLKYRWGEALTWNVWGGIEAKFHDPYLASRYCGEALQIFSMLGDERGIGLSSLWLGRAYRRLGIYTHHFTPPDSQNWFEKAEELFENARRIFESQVQEPIRLIETIAEQGKLCRDRAKVRRRNQVEAENSKDGMESLEARSEALLKEAIGLADQMELPAESADCRQDLANLYYVLGRFDDAIQVLQEAEDKLPPGCILTPARQPDKLDRQVPGYLEILGKINMSRGDIAYEQGDVEKAIKLWTLAAGYFDLFSRNAWRFVEELATDVGKKLFNETSERLKELEQVCARTEQEYGLERSYWHNELARLAERRR